MSCTNGTCWARIGPVKGMQTNGRCGCLDDLPKPVQREVMRKIAFLERVIWAQQIMAKPHRQTIDPTLLATAIDVLSKARELGVLK